MTELNSFNNFIGESDTRAGKLTSPGKNMKPMFDGTFKEAGAPLDQYVLENDNGSRAIVRTYGGNS